MNRRSFLGFILSSAIALALPGAKVMAAQRNVLEAQKPNADPLEWRVTRSFDIGRLGTSDTTTQRGWACFSQKQFTPRNIEEWLARKILPPQPGFVRVSTNVTSEVYGTTVFFETIDLSMEAR